MMCGNLYPVFKRPRKYVVILVVMVILSTPLSSSSLSLSLTCRPTPGTRKLSVISSSYTRLQIRSKFSKRKIRTNIISSRGTTVAIRMSSNDNEQWEAGDWESDLKALESAVALCNASTDLDQKERKDLLDYFALQRRDLIPDILDYMIRPVVMALSLIILTLSTTTSSRSDVMMPFHGTIQKWIQFLLGISNLHFWTMCLCIPLLHNILIKVKPLQRRRKNEWEMEYIDPRDDTSNSFRCLLENWAVSFYPMTLFGIIATVAMSCRIVTNRFLHDWIILAWMFGQLLTRLGSVASMYQFPKYLYDLQREEKKGPIPFLPACLGLLKRCYMSMLQIGFATDVCQLSNRINNMRIMMTMKQPISSRVLFGNLKPREQMIMISLITLFLSTVFMAVGQLIAFQELFRIGYFTKISLATPEHLLKELLNDPDASRMKLRYRMKWREPKRVFSSFRRTFQRFWLFLFSGWGEDAGIISESSSSLGTPYLLTLIKKDMEKGLYDPKPDREKWISDASKKMAEIHEENYDNNSFEDPLGIAFYMTFGIGMSLDFDHDSKLNEDESPSVHRLRARAVKSAIKRYNQIPAMVERDLEKMGSTNDRDRMKKKLVKEERMKLKKDVKRLLRLIPSNAPAPEGKDLDVLSMRQSEIFSTGPSLIPLLENIQSQSTDDQDSDIDPYLGDNIFGNDNQVFS